MSAEGRVWTVLDLLRWTTEHFRSKGIESARLDAECLLAHALGCERLRLYLEHEKPVVESERARFRDLVKRRAEDRVPVAHLTGRREFWSLDLRITPDVLVPRPETETLVEAALQHARGALQDLRILDVGTGSGAVALALARELPAARITATDVCATALDVARSNAEALGLAERVRFARGDVFGAVPGERFDLVVSNPPYLGHEEAGSLPPELSHEPAIALFAGADGTDLLRRLAAEAPGALEAGGLLAVELAPPQAPTMTQWMAEAGFGEIRVQRDFAGRARVVTGRHGGRGQHGEPRE